MDESVQDERTRSLCWLRWLLPMRKQDERQSDVDAAGSSTKTVMQLRRTTNKMDAANHQITDGRIEAAQAL